MDARVKMAALAMVGIAAGAAGAPGLALMSVLVALGIRDVRLDTGGVLHATRLLAVMLGLAAVVRALSVSGEPLLGLGPLALSRQGAMEGLLFAWRILVVVLGGVLLTVSTRPWAVRAAVAWILGPLPLIPARRVATMMGLVVRFIPEILNQAGAVREAQRARGAEACGNPVRRLALFASALMRRTLLRADRLTSAMAARCYNEARIDPPLAATSVDMACLGAIGLVTLAAVLL